jgi:hypothetical protein
MARDFSIRPDLLKLGVPERTIRVLEKAALIVDTIERVTGTETSLDTVNTQIDTLQEAVEDANLSLESLDGRLDTIENGNGPYVKKAGDVMTGALDVHALVQCDSFRIDATPTAETITPTHTVTISVNGTDYKIPIVAA